LNSEQLGFACPSEVEVLCAEKDSGFFAALRMTQRKNAPARIDPAPTLGYAKLA
jgi:hypothetical protein